jgi:hypothetical protein
MLGLWPTILAIISMNTKKGLSHPPSLYLCHLGLHPVTPSTDLLHLYPLERGWSSYYYAPRYCSLCWFAGTCVFWTTSSPGGIRHSPPWGRTRQGLQGSYTDVLYAYERNEVAGALMNFNRDILFSGQWEVKHGLKTWVFFPVSLTRQFFAPFDWVRVTS